VAAESLAAQLRQKHSEMMISEVTGVALRLFEERGFDTVTVDEVAATAQISVRTFYRYFPAKEDVLQVHIDRRAAALRRALAERPADEAPLHSLAAALADVVSAEDPVLRLRWTSVVATTPSVLPGVLGGIQLKSLRTMADFLGARLDLPSDSLVPTMLAAAVGGVIQAASTQWFVHGGDLGTMIAEGIEVLERGIGSDPQAWSNQPKQPRSPGRTKPPNRRRPD
jgi:TetR/AcrR family transcriptional regulator, regulator of mycofactocin system